MEDERKTRPRYTAQRYLNSQSGLSFDGVDDAIGLFNDAVGEDLLTAVNIKEPLSFSFWFKVDENPTGGVILSFTSTLGYRSFFLIVKYVPTFGTLVFDFQQNFVTGSIKIKRNVNYHCVICNDTVNNLFSIYINNFLISTSNTIPDYDIETNRHNTKCRIGIRTFLGSNPPFNGSISHFATFSKVLDQGEISALHTWKGHIPESAQPNLIEYLPLQYNDFVNDTVFKDVDTNTFPVNQTAHGLNVGDIIAYDDTSWSNYTNILPIQTPQVVVEVVDADNFVYSESGKYTFPSAHNLGNTGDVIYRDGTTVGKDNPIYKILSPTEIQIASELALWCVGARKQFNWKKASNDVLEESYGKVFGYNVEELLTDTTGTNRITAQKDFYEDDAIIHPYGRWYDRNSWDDVPETDMPVSFASNYSIYLNIELDPSEENGGVFWYGNSNSKGDDGTGTQVSVFYRDAKTMVTFFSNSDSGTKKRFYQQYFYSEKKEKNISLCFVKGSNTDSSKIKILDENGVLTPLNGLISNFTYNLPLEDKTAISPDIVSIGRRPNDIDGIPRIQAIISKLQWISRPFTDQEAMQVCKDRTTDFVEPDDSMYAYELDFKNTKEGESLKTTPRSSKQHIFTRKGSTQTALAREKKSFYPEIYQGIHLQNINAGGDRDMWIELDKSELPNASDDFTFHWSGYMNSQDIPILASTGNPFFVISSFTNGAWNESFPRIEFIWWKKVAALPYSNWLTFIYLPNSYNGVFVEIKIEVKDPLTITVTREKGIVKLYLNGVLHRKGNTISNESFDLPSTIMRIGSTKGINGAGLTDYVNNVASSFGYWKRALSNLEILHLHGEGKPNNPWDNLPSDYNVNMKQELKIWHQFQEGSIYEDGTDFKIKNWANSTGSTDAVLKESNATGGTLLDLQGWRDRVKSLK